MGDRPRPPLASIDAGWDDETGLRPEGRRDTDPGVAPVTPPPPPPDEPSRRGEPPETTALLGQEQIEEMRRERQRDEEGTVTYQAQELDALVQRTARPATGESETVALGSGEIDQLLGAPARARVEGGGFRVGGPPPEPKPDLGDDPFAGLEMEAPPAAAREPEAGAAGGWPLDATPDPALAPEPAQRFAEHAGPGGPGSVIDARPAPGGSPMLFDASAPAPPAPIPRGLTEPMLSPGGPAPWPAPPSPPGEVAREGQPSRTEGGAAIDARTVTGAPRPVPPPSAPVHVAVIAAGVAALAVAVTVGAWLIVRGRSSGPAAAAPGQPAGIVIPAGSSAPPPVPVETEVRDALARLRDGVGVCVRENIKALPGTSAAVPPRVEQLRGGAYTSSAEDWRKPVWSCAKFKVTVPQRFQVQWQQTRKNREGRAVAWLDDDRDGKADRAFGFTASLPKGGELELGEIVELEAPPPIAAR